MKYMNVVLALFDGLVLLSLLAAAVFVMYKCHGITKLIEG